MRKIIVDAGHETTMDEARNILGDKVPALQDEDKDLIKTGLRVFFGAYPNMMVDQPAHFSFKETTKSGSNNHLEQKK